MELFDKKCVYCMWEDKLDGVAGFIADNVESLHDQIRRNGDPVVTVTSSGDEGWPFKDEEEVAWKFFYYDPMYLYKRDFIRGKKVQYRVNGEGPWEDVQKDHEWNPDYEYLTGLGASATAEIRAENVDLMEWLAKGKGMYRTVAGGMVRSSYEFEEDDTHRPVPASLRVRRWDDPDWREPFRSYLQKD